MSETRSDAPPTIAGRNVTTGKTIDEASVDDPNQSPTCASSNGPSANVLGTCS